MSLLSVLRLNAGTKNEPTLKKNESTSRKRMNAEMDSNDFRHKEMKYFSLKAPELRLSIYEFGRICTRINGERFSRAQSIISTDDQISCVLPNCESLQFGRSQGLKSNKF